MASKNLTTAAMKRSLLACEKAGYIPHSTVLCQNGDFRVLLQADEYLISIKTNEWDVRLE